MMLYHSGLFYFKEQMNTTNDVLTSSINYPIRSEEEKINDYVNVQSQPIKLKSLR